MARDVEEVIRGILWGVVRGEVKEWVVMGGSLKKGYVGKVGEVRGEELCEERSSR